MKIENGFTNEEKEYRIKSLSKTKDIKGNNYNRELRDYYIKRFVESLQAQKRQLEPYCTKEDILQIVKAVL